MPPQPDADSGPPGPGDRLADRFHLRSGQPEPVGVEDRLVTQLQRAQAGGGEGLCGGRAGAHHARRPPVRLAQRKPGGDRLRPGAWIADRVTAGQAHTHLDPVGDRRVSVGREHDRLVAAGREVAQRVVLAVAVQQRADGQLVLPGERVVRALGLEQHHGRRHQRQRAEQPEQRVEDGRRASGEQVGGCGGEPADPVDRVGQPVFGLQRSGEQFEQTPAEQDSHHVARQQHRRGFEQGAAPHPCPELAAGQDQHHDRGDVEAEPEELARALESGARLLGERDDVEADGHGEDDDQHPPRDPLARGQCAGHHRQRERPGEAGVGEVEQVVVDEIPRRAGEVADQR